MGRGNLRSLLRAPGLCLGLPADIRVCHGKFGKASSYMDQMYKEQTDRQIFFFIYVTDKTEIWSNLKFVRTEVEF
jgi:hypothetical protein